MQAYQERFGIRLLQLWGLTETSPVAVASYPPRGVDVESAEGLDWRARTGRPLPGVELRIVGDDDAVLPWDGEAVGEIESRGSWITGAYYGDPAPEKFHDGWLRTGDIGSITPNGYVRISDRSKDVIKSGGEWISSVELEGHLMAHPCVAEAAVVGVPDPRWTERPLACVVLRPDVSVTPSELQAFLAEYVAKWQLPERWTFIAEVPKTSVGKFDKKVLRARHENGELVIDTIG
jgi:fatty-acyl-CoA synthase